MHTIHVKFCYYSSSLFRYSPRRRYRMDSCVRTSLPSRQGRQLRSLLFFKMLLLWDLWLKPTAPAPLPLPHDTSGCLLFTFPSALRLGVKELHALPLFAYPPCIDRDGFESASVARARLILAHCFGVSSGSSPKPPHRWHHQRGSSSTM
jgi:hypothetical protein